MEKTHMGGASLRPEAYVSTRKSRLPVYKDNCVYLRNGQEFELELFNPTTKTVGIYIKFNGIQTSSSMLVLRPGMRFFLDRYVDEARKFVFNTYEAENTAGGRAATAENGLIEVSFYDERVAQPVFSPPVYIPPVQQQPYNPYNPIWWTTTTPILGGPSSINIGSTMSGATNNCYFSSSSSPSSATSSFADTSGIFRSGAGGQASSTFETGRVEKGGESSQSFGSYHGDFESFPSHTVTMRIKPESQRAEALRRFCTSCGKRLNKPTWKFCPSCGSAV